MCQGWIQGGGGGGILGVTGPIRISFRLGGSRSMKVAVLFCWGGRCQRKSKPWGKLPLCPPPLNDQLPRTVKSFFPTADIFYAVFLFRDPPSSSFWIRPCMCVTKKKRAREKVWRMRLTGVMCSQGNLRECHYSTCTWLFTLT